MTTTAQVILDSISPDGVRLTTLQLKFPKFLLAQFNTHRIFSRSSSSSRAIPVMRLIEDIRRDPVQPPSWFSSQPGMQPGEVLPPNIADKLNTEWLRGRDDAIERAVRMYELGAAKEIINRVIEPWVHCRVVVTATDFSNFFDLRLHGDAQNEMRILAQHMWAAMVQAEPQFLHHGEWHLPYITAQDDAPLHELKKASASRCARVSYLTHEGKTPNLDADLALYDRLITSKPAHASPAEHQACPDVATKSGWESPHLHGNFRGWQQFRKVLGL